MTYTKTLATSVTTTAVPATEGVAEAVWTSDSVALGSNFPGLRVVVNFEAINPDTAVVSPFNFEMVPIVQIQNDDNTWSEVARSALPIRKLDQGAKHEIFMSPQVNAEEGVANIIAGFNGVPEIVKSKFEGSGVGVVRVVLFVVDNDKSGPNPFVSVTLSAHISRFDV